MLLGMDAIGMTRARRRPDGGRLAVAPHV
ncbi:hypothetical protein [Thauera sp.]